MNVLFYAGFGGSGGYLRYCQGLLRPGVIPAGVEVQVVATGDLLKRIGEVDSAVKVVRVEELGSPFRAQRYWWHLVGYPSLLRRIRPDVEFFASGDLRVLGRRAVSVVTCHNLLLFDAAELTRYRLASDRANFRRYRKRQIISIERASGVIFLSSYSRRAVEAITGPRPASIVIPHGIDAGRFRNGRRSYKFGPIVSLVYVSSIHPYKNHGFVVRELHRFRKRSGIDVQLRIVGPPHQASLDDLRHTIAEEDAEAFVSIEEAQPQGDLPRLLAGADLFVFASSSETFGLSLLEAMAAGLPIACSSRTGLPDLAGEGAIYFDPSEEGSLAEALRRLANDENLRERVGRIAQARASNYTWEKCALETYGFIGTIAGARHSREGKTGEGC